MTPDRRLILVIGLAALALAVACGDSDPQTPTPKPPQAAPAPEPAPTPEPAPEPTPPPPAAEPAADATRGGEIYAIYCATCHGPRGEGDGPAAAALDPKPAKHNDAAYMDALSDEHLFKVIQQGGPAVGKSPLMAPWGGTLSDAQIRDLVAFIRTLPAR